MILDEPTTGLDLKYILHFFQILKSLVSEQGKSILLSIHDLNHAIQFCDEILVMKKGQLLFYGYPTEPDFLPAIEDAYEITFKQSLQLQIEAMKLN